jgi:hypothetical protein
LREEERERLNSKRIDDEESYEREKRRIASARRNRKEVSPEYRENLARCDREYYRKKIENDPDRKKIRLEWARKKREKRATADHVIGKYEEALKKGPTIVCVCCGGLFFRRQMLVYKWQEKNETIHKQIFQMQIVARSDQEHMICRTCQLHAKDLEMGRRKTVSRFCLTAESGLRFNKTQPCLEVLNDVEERIVSPRIAFLRITPLVIGPQGQYGLKGS